MENVFTLEYWIDDDWYVGKLKEIPGVFSQGETLDELAGCRRSRVSSFSYTDFTDKQ